jgi:hypothetical protein
MTDTPATAAAPVREPGRWLIWTAGLIVAIGAAIATAHGLYRVALAATVPAPIGWLYPLITDGLALVAYASTTRLAAGGRRYAWAVVVLAAGLSGLAQASYLAIGVDSAPVQLRFGVGAWPATAAAITAHLLYLLAAHPATVQPAPTVQQIVGRLDGPVQPGLGQAVVGRRGAERLDTAVQTRATVHPARGEQRRPVGHPEAAEGPADSGRLSGSRPSAGAGMPDRPRRSFDGPLSRPDDGDPVGLPPSRRATDQAVTPVEPAAGVQPGVQPTAAPPVQPASGDDVRPDGVQPATGRPARPQGVGQPDLGRPSQPEPAPADVGHPVGQAAVQSPGPVGHPRGEAETETPLDRALAAGRVHQVTHGDLPSVRTLAEAADVARGTAATALKHLRDTPAGARPALQIVHDDQTAGTNP